MPRIRTIAPRIATLRPLIASPTTSERERSRYRDATQPWRRWYKTSRWQRLRMSILVRDAYTCQMCGSTWTDTSMLVADHIQPHRGDERLFWQESNLWCLCKPCHDGAKQREERRASARERGARSGYRGHGPDLPAP